MAISKHSCGPLTFILEQKSVGCCWCNGGLFQAEPLIGDLWGTCAAPASFFPSCSPAALLILSVFCMWPLHVACCFSFNHRECELRIWFFKILCPVWVWGYPELRHHAHGSGAPRPRQVSAAGLYGNWTRCSRKNAAAPTATVSFEIKQNRQISLTTPEGVEFNFISSGSS